MQKTWSQKKSEIKREWKLIDASGRSVGRLASEAAKLIRGKHKPEFTPHMDGGDFVVVINSDKARLTGNKWQDKKYYTHSRFVGSLREFSAKDKKIEDIITLAVKGMLPKNKTRDSQLKRLKVYSGSEHKHEAQKVQEHKFK